MMLGLEQMIFQDIRADHPLALSKELSQRGTEVVARPKFTRQTVGRGTSDIAPMSLERVDGVRRTDMERKKLFIMEDPWTLYFGYVHLEEEEKVHVKK